MPRRTVHPGFIAGVNVFTRAASPFLAAGNQFELNHTFCAQVHGDVTSEPLGREWHEDSGAFAQGSLHLGTVNNLRKMWRPNLFFAFRDKNKIDGEFFPRAANRVQSREECGFRALLIYRSAANDDFAEAGFVHHSGVERRRRPFRGVRLLYVVHEIQADGSRRTGVERRENAGLPIRGYFAYLTETGVAKHVHGEFATFVHTAIFRSDGRLANPGLQALHAFVVTLGDFGVDSVKVSRGRVGAVRPGERSSARYSSQ